VAAADQLVLTKLVLGRTARKYGLRVSFSPVPFAGTVGSGAHQHFSLSDDSGSLFEGGDGPSGMTRRGRHVVAGLVDGLPEAQAILCGSVVSGLRMKPGHWAGAYTCWGTENREAAIRFLPAGPGKPHGANVEVKVIDPSANPYFASAAILALALDGLDRELALPPETTVDPATLTAEERAAAGTALLPSDQGSALAALDGSTRLRAALGDQAVDAILAVRRYENDNFGDLAPEALTDRFRMAWSV
jgi:glutamine synthetase